jgi:hypothetical protein
MCCVTDQHLPPPNLGGNCLANFNGMAFAKEALLWYQRYKEPTPEEIAQDKQAEEYLKTLGLAPRVKENDSASFLTNVLDSMSWGCVFNVNTGKDLKTIIERASKSLSPFPKIGDVVVWKTQVAVVTNVCVGGRVEVTAQTAEGFVNSGCKALAEIKALKPATEADFIGFWTPK